MKAGLGTAVTNLSTEEWQTRRSLPCLPRSHRKMFSFGQVTVPERYHPLACCTSQRRSVSFSPPCERTADTVCLSRRGKHTPAGVHRDTEGALSETSRFIKYLPRSDFWSSTRDTLLNPTSQGPLVLGDNTFRRFINSVFGAIGQCHEV